MYFLIVKMLLRLLEIGEGVLVVPYIREREVNKTKVSKRIKEIVENMYYAEYSEEERLLVCLRVCISEIKNKESKCKELLLKIKEASSSIILKYIKELIAKLYIEIEEKDNMPVLRILLYESSHLPINKTWEDINKRMNVREVESMVKEMKRMREKNRRHYVEFKELWETIIENIDIYMGRLMDIE